MRHSAISESIVSNLYAKLTTICFEMKKPYYFENLITTRTQTTRTTTTVALGDPFPGPKKC